MTESRQKTIRREIWFYTFVITGSIGVLFKMVGFSEYLTVLAIAVYGGHIWEAIEENGNKR